MNEVASATKWASKMYMKSGKITKEENEQPETIAVQEFVTTPARVKVALGMTINIGNYESLRVDCGIELPCYVEEREDAQETAFKLCEHELFRRVNEVKANL